MIDKEQFRIFQILGLENLVLNPPYDLEVIQGQAAIEAKHSFWLCRVKFVGDDSGLATLLGSIDTPGGSKQIAFYWLFVVKARNYYRGHLLFPSIREPFDREFGGAKPLVPIDLEGWNDPVAEALKSISFVLTDEPREQWLWEYRLCYATWNGYGEFNDESWMEGKPLSDKMWAALFATTEHFIGLYDDDEMRAYFRHLRFIE